MIAIAFLFICVLCDCFKSRRPIFAATGVRVRKLPIDTSELKWE
jgi:hypothetical protein